MSERLKRIETRYDRLFASSPEGTSRYGEAQPFLRYFLETLPVGSEISDLGAGDGRNALFLARAGYRVNAYDLSQVGIDHICRSANVEGLAILTTCLDLNAWRTDHPVDGYVVSAVLHHFSAEQAFRILDEMRASTCSGGVHAISCFLPRGDLFEVDGPHGNFYPELADLDEVYKGWRLVYRAEGESMLRDLRAKGDVGKNAVLRVIFQKV